MTWQLTLHMHSKSQLTLCMQEIRQLTICVYSTLTHTCKQLIYFTILWPYHSFKHKGKSMAAPPRTTRRLSALWEEWEHDKGEAGGALDPGDDPSDDSEDDNNPPHRAPLPPRQ